MDHVSLIVEMITGNKIPIVHVNPVMLVVKTATVLRIPSALCVTRAAIYSLRRLLILA